MRVNQSFNPGVTAYIERLYQFSNGQLKLQYGAGAVADFYHINSFEWTVPGREFEIQGVQVYSFMSSTLTRFTFRKVF